ncbi:MAG: hypothetical protein CSYNP_00027 [Syntrophus sp. SKADARSKE-3]|nr:hypothetical protein [Syntrophus sp. SKADARSKE-3]
MTLRLQSLIHGEPDALAGQALLFFTAIQVFFNPFPQITAVHEIGFYFSLLILAYLLIRHPESRLFLKSPLTVPFGLFIFWTLAGLPFALNQANSIHDIYAHLIKYMLFYYLVIFVFRTRFRFTALTWLITLSSAIFSIGIMTHYYIVLGKRLTERLGLMTYSEMPTNIIPTITVFAAVLSACHFLRARDWRQKAVSVFFIAIFMATTFATQSKGAFIAFVVGMLSFLSFDKKKLAIFTSVFILTVGTIQVTTQYFTPMVERLAQEPRIGIWYNYMEISKDYPIAGIGFGMQTYHDDAFLEKYNRRVPAAYRENLLIRAPHNMVIDVAVRTGWIGLCLFAIIMVFYMRMAWDLVKRRQDVFLADWGRCTLAAFFVIIFQGLLENTLNGPPALILYIIFAMATILWKMEPVTVNTYGSQSVPESPIPGNGTANTVLGFSTQTFKP